MAERKRKMTKRQQKKLLKAVFGKALPTVTLVVTLLILAFYGAYTCIAPFHTWVDEVILQKTTIAPRPYIDPNGSELAVHFIDVGQGDSTLFQTAEGSILVDCGETEYGETVVAYLQAQGIDELEYFIITHPDSDHMGCAAYVLEHIEVKTFVMNGQEKSAKFFEDALDILLEKQIDTLVVKPGDEINLGALRIDVLGPQRLDYSTAEWNNASIILYATYGHRSFLLTGDAEKTAENDLLEKYADSIRCDVFSAGHHGSNSSNSQKLLDAALPEYVVISCGENNKHGHPHQEVVDRFVENGFNILRTDLHGSIVFITDGENLNVIKEK